MSVSIMDTAQRHAYSVEVGAQPLTTILCNADLRADFERTGTEPYRRVLAYTLEELEEDGRRAEDALALMRAWGCGVADP